MIASRSLQRVLRHPIIGILAMSAVILAGTAPNVTPRNAAAAVAATHSPIVTPTLAVAPTSGVPNQALTITGNAFATDTAITVQFVQDSNRATLATFSLIGNGNFMLNSAVPLTATPGAAGIVACYSSGDCPPVALASTPFNVNTPTTTLAPNPALPGATVTITGSNFGAGETVSVTISAAFLFTATADGGGGFSAMFTAPAVTGTYTITATGLSTGLRVENPLMVVAPAPAPTNTPTPMPTGTLTPTATSTSTPSSPTPASTSTPAPSPTPTSTPCTGPGNSCAAHTCPKGKHAVHGHCVSDFAHLHIFVIRVVHPPLRHRPVLITIVNGHRHVVVIVVAPHKSHPRHHRRHGSPPRKTKRDGGGVMKQPERHAKH